MKNYNLLLAILLILSTATYAQQLSTLDKALTQQHPKNIFPEDADKNYLFKSKQKNSRQDTFIATTKSAQTTFLAEVFSAYPSHYDVQTSWKSNQPIKKGDVILARFIMRSTYANQESGDAVVNFYVQQSLPPNDKSIMTTLGAGPEWKEFNIPFVASADMDTGGAAICFSFGSLAQRVEITAIEILNYQETVKIEQLPKTRFTYKGREANAPWREAALKRIEQIRTASLAVKVVDRQGNPIKDVKVNARLVKSDFLFGTAVSAGLLCSDKSGSGIYQKKLKELFNTVTIDNGLKWGSWVNSGSQLCTKEAVNWINNNGFRLRGHNLVWPSRKFSPESYKQKLNFGVGFTDSITKHIKEIVTYTKGKVVAWDVLNEMAHEKDYFEVMPRSTVADWFKLAKRTDPNAQLFINEYGMLNSISSTQMINTYLELIDELKGYGAPIDAMGVQGHVGTQPRDPALVISDLDLLAKAGIPIQITEFDVNTTDDELQADYTRDFLIACYSHPSVTGFTMWGFWEPAHWKPDAAMFRRDWSAKPNAKVWTEWVTKKWATNVTLTTNERGEAGTNGHLGEYEITISKDKFIKKQLYQLKKGTNQIILDLWH